MSDPYELTREELQQLADSNAADAYLAWDRIDFVRECLATATGPVDPDTVRRWLDRPICMRTGCPDTVRWGKSVSTADGRLYVDLTHSGHVHCAEISRDDATVLRNMLDDLLDHTAPGEN